jgi:hypothetical protein
VAVLGSAGRERAGESVVVRGGALLLGHIGVKVASFELPGTENRGHRASELIAIQVKLIETGKARKVGQRAFENVLTNRQEPEFVHLAEHGAINLRDLVGEETKEDHLRVTHSEGAVDGIAARREVDELIQIVDAGGLNHTHEKKQRKH